MVQQLHLAQGILCDVIVTSVVTPAHLFLQQPLHPSFVELKRLDELMLALYGLPVGAPKAQRPLEIGFVCAAPVLSGWYRALIIEVYPETDEVLLRYLDYGGYGRCCGDDLRKIRRDFLRLPFQATECHLAHIQPIRPNVGWSSEAQSFMENLSYGRWLEAVVVGKSALHGAVMIELFDRSTGQCMCLNQILVERGFASWVVEVTQKAPHTSTASPAAPLPVENGVRPTEAGSVAKVHNSPPMCV
jgi:A-kinase anchor protein 1